MKTKGAICLILLACLLLAVLVIGCGKRGQGGDGVSADGKVEIKFWHSYVSDTMPALEALIERFEAENPGITIKEQYVQTGEVLLQKLTTAIMTEDTPDICWIHSSWVAPLSDEDVIYDLGELAEQFGGFDEEVKADFFEAPLETSYYKGKLRMMPIEGTNLALAYNKDHFREAGLDPNNPPEDWDEFVEYGNRLVIREGEEIKRYACVVPAFTGQHAGWGTWQWMTFLWGWGGRFANPNGKEVDFNSPAGVGALQFWVDLQNKYKIGSMNAPDQGFESQMVSMSLMGPWSLPSLNEMEFDWGMAPMPAGPEKQVTSLGAEYLVVFKNTKHAEEAWKFITWFITPEVQEQWSKDSKYLPIRKSVLESPSYQEFLTQEPALGVFARQMEFAYAEPNILPQVSEVTIYLSEAIEKAVRQVSTPKAALNEAAQKSNIALAKALEAEKKREAAKEKTE